MRNCLVCFKPIKTKKFCSIACRYDRIYCFWQKVKKTDDCWLWTGNKNDKNYGRFVWFDREEYAHRVSYIIAFGSIPKGLHILHSCDNPQCVNPVHLTAGTHGDNMRDMFAKNRRQNPKGEQNGNNKLTADQVIEIRRIYKKRITPLTKLAEQFGVDRTTIHQIVTNKTWKELSATTGGVSICQETKQLDGLSANVRLLLGD